MGVVYKIFVVILLFYLTVMFFSYHKSVELTHNFSGSNIPSSDDIPILPPTLVKNPEGTPKINNQPEQGKEVSASVKKTDNEPKEDPIAALKKYLASNQQDKNIEAKSEVKAVHSFENLANIFHLLGAYSERDTMYVPERLQNFSLGIINDDNYCEAVDAYNLANPQNLLETKHFMTDYYENSVPRAKVMAKIGEVVMKEIKWTMKEEDAKSRKYHLKPEINNFFLSSGSFHQYHKIGQHFACATQMYNHIPGTSSLFRKDSVINAFKAYADKYEGKPQCFDRSKLFPQAYRLYDQVECENFFTMINSADYQESLIDEPLQYLLKIGHGSHKSQGIFLMDQDLTTFVNSHFENGAMCGVENHSLIAQSYVKNPLLLDRDNKFDFRVYMLIASTNPFIVYYHDGFIKVSINSYEKSSNDRATHLTNTYLANQKIEEAKSTGELIHGMTEKELQEYILWNFDRLQAYLLDSGKIPDPNWLDNYLRPAFHKAYIHLIRMSGASFSKQSNLYELHGLDFMLDDEMNLWFIESNPGPQLSGTSQDRLYYDVLMGLFDINYAYYRSRMKRVLNVISSIQKDFEQSHVVDYNKYREEYQKAVQNRLEPEYQISSSNTWTLVMDESLSGSQAYMGYISEECL